MTRDEAEDLLRDLNPEALFADGFDEAILGITDVQPGPRDPVVVYDRDKMIEVLEREMPEQEAIEYFQFNIAGAWVGDNTPLFLLR